MDGHGPIGSKRNNKGIVLEFGMFIRIFVKSKKKKKSIFIFIDIYNCLYI